MGVTKPPLCTFILVAVLLCCNKAACQNVTKVRLQEDGKASVESMLDAGIGALPELSQLTICVRIFLLNSASFNPIVSYFAGDYDNEISFWVNWDLQLLEFFCCQNRVRLQMKMPVILRTWQHICFATDLKAGQYWVAFDDIFKEGNLSAIDPGTLKILSGGRMVMGQELDTIQGSFNLLQSFHGDIANFLLLSKALDPSYLKMYVRCQTSMVDSETILSFNEDLSSFQVKGSTLISEVPLEELCQKKKKVVFILPERRNFRNALDSCSRMNSVLPVPKSEAENKELFHEFVKFNNHCVEATATIYWVGLKGDFEKGQWLRQIDNAEITWDGFATGYEQVLEDSLCVSVGGKDFPYLWYAANCELKTCPLCSFSDTASFTVRGLCKDTLFDHTLTMYDYKNFKPQFLGPFYTSIYWSNVSMTWMMKNRAHEDFVGIMEMEAQDGYPIGVNTWNITGDTCNSNQIQMMITACNASEYTCNDGKCIAKAQRCDKIIDCPDQSDEFNCNIILTPVGYSNELPPPMTDNLPVPIKLFIGITSVREIDILNFKVALDVILELRWRDRRLRMKNLRIITKANKVQKPKEVWQPTLQIEDGSMSLADVMPRSKSLIIIREDNPIPDDDSQLNEDDLYLGSENTLFLHQVNTIGFTCQFQLQRYPFDTQVCSLTFSLIDVSSDVVILMQHNKGLNFLGQKRLLEYEVTKVNMTFLNNSGDTGGQKVVIELKNLYGYYISSTYIPTTLLVIICYLTLYFDINDFTDRVMVSLTSLLVLAALFSQTSQSIPKTSYLKLIDLWFVFLIVIEFLIVLVLVIIENLRLKTPSQIGNNMKVFISVKPEGNEVHSRNISRSKSRVNRNTVFANTVAVTVIPIIIAIFFISYSIICGIGL